MNRIQSNQKIRTRYPNSAREANPSKARGQPRAQPRSERPPAETVHPYTPCRHKLLQGRRWLFRQYPGRAQRTSWRCAATAALVPKTGYRKPYGVSSRDTSTQRQPDLEYGPASAGHGRSMNRLPPDFIPTSYFAQVSDSPTPVIKQRSSSNGRAATSVARLSWTLMSIRHRAPRGCRPTRACERVAAPYRFPAIDCRSIAAVDGSKARPGSNYRAPSNRTAPERR